jgi:ABC-type thiamine transport system substrate-binding protein
VRGRGLCGCHGRLSDLGVSVCLCVKFRYVQVLVFEDFLRNHNAGETVSLKHDRDYVCEFLGVVFGSY